MIWLLACTGKTPTPALAEEAPPLEPALVQDLSQAEKVTFLVLGDTGYTEGSAAEVGAHAAATCARIGCDFTVFLGDNVYNNGVKSVDDPLFEEAYERPFGGIGVPAWMVLGNHDHLGNIQAQIDYSARSQTWTMPARHYRVPGLPEWLVLYGWDSQELKKRPDSELSQQMLTELEQALCSTDGWALPFAHHPNESSGVHGRGPELDGIRALTEPIWQKCGVQASFAGHDHHLEVMKSAGYLTLISGSGSKTRGVCDNTGPAKRTDTCATRGGLTQKFLSGEYGYMALTLTETTGRMDVYVLGTEAPVWGMDLSRGTE